jgi:predicted MFS family arabinose efflux permease
MGTLTESFGPRIFMTLGPITSGIGILTLLQLPAHPNYWLYILPGILLFGIGLTLTVTPLTVTVMRSVDERHSGIASGINNAVSRIAGLFVIAVLGIFGAALSYHFAVLLCGTMAILAGIVSFLVIRNPNK